MGSKARTGFQIENFLVIDQSASQYDGFSSEVVSIPLLGAFKPGPKVVVQVGQRGPFSGVRSWTVGPSLLRFKIQALILLEEMESALPFSGRRPEAPSSLSVPRWLVPIFLPT